VGFFYFVVFVLRRDSLYWRCRKRLSERDSSGTTERMTRSGRREGDGADSPTRAADAPEVRSGEAARPNPSPKKNILKRVATKLKISHTVKQIFYWS
jgi:hypothetical protein